MAITRKVRFFRMHNGMIVYTQEDSSTHLMGLGIGTGSMNDPDNAKGMHHFNEHLIINPALEKYLQLERKLREVGCSPSGGVNIRTTMNSVFFGTDMLLRRNFSLDVLAMIADTIKNPNITADNLNSEIAAIRNEHNLHEKDNPANIMIHNALLDLIYRKNPAKKGLFDDIEQLEKLRPQQVSRFINQHYVGGNMYAIIFGPSYNQAKRIAEKYLSDIPRGEAPKLDYDGSEPMGTLTKVESFLIEKEGLNTHHVGIGFPVPPAGQNDAEALEVLSEVLELRLETELRKKNIDPKKGTYHPLVNTDTTKYHGLFSIWFPTQSESSSHESLEKTLHEIEKIKKWGVDSEEIEKALTNYSEKRHKKERKNRVREFRSEFKLDVDMGITACKTGHKEGYETTSGVLAETVIKAYCNGDQRVRGVNNYLELLSSVTPTRVAKVADKYFPRDKFALVMVNPIKGTQNQILTPNFYEQEFKDGKPRQMSLDFTPEQDVLIT